MTTSRKDRFFREKNQNFSPISIKLSHNLNKEHSLTLENRENFQSFLNYLKNLTNRTKKNKFTSRTLQRRRRCRWSAWSYPTWLVLIWQKGYRTRRSKSVREDAAVASRRLNSSRAHRRQRSRLPPAPLLRQGQGFWCLFGLQFLGYRSLLPFPLVASAFLFPALIFASGL